MADVDITNFSISKRDFISGENLTFNFNIHNNHHTTDITRITIKLTSDTNYTYTSSYTRHIPKRTSAELTLSMIAKLTATQRASEVTITISAFAIDSNTGEEKVMLGREVGTALLLNKRYKPNIVNFELYRALNGSKNDEGVDILSTIKIAKNYSDTPDSFVAKLYYSSSGEATTSSSSIPLDIDTLISGVTESSTLITKTFANSYDWDFMLYFGDGYERATKHFSIGKTKVNVHLAGGDDANAGLGVCFGGFCKRSAAGEPQFESYYPSVFYEDVVADKGLTVKGAINAQGGIINSSDYSGTRSYVGSFGKYPTDGCNPTLKTSGSVAFLSGIITPTTTITGNATQHVICTIPTEYAPKNIVSVLQQGTGTATWLLRIYPSGHSEYPAQVTFARYRNADGYKTISPSDDDIPWLPFSATWIF